MVNYKDSGVDIEEGYRAVEKYKEYASSTMNNAVLNGIGSFAGMYSLKEFMQTAENASQGMVDPVLISGTDGVGTKMDIAMQMEKHDTVGIDCVAMCVNDIICHGARPLFFLDYLACGKLNAEIAADIVKGIAEGCRETGMVLLGGETAEHPGIIPDDVYDLAGFAVGIADREKIIDGSKIKEGDVILGLASSGVHSNGFSLMRKVIENMNENFDGDKIGKTLLKPTRLYVKPVLELMKRVEIHGMANISGGGFYENIPRMFPKNSRLLAVVEYPYKDDRKNVWEIPDIFIRIAYGIKYPEKRGEIIAVTGIRAMQEGVKLIYLDDKVKEIMFNTFNMGIGFVMALSPKDAETAIKFLETMGIPSYVIGRVEQESTKRESGRLYFV